MDLSYWGFECKCEACDEAGDRFDEGEKRRGRMYEISQHLRCFDEGVLFASEIKRVRSALAAVEVLAELCIMEGVVGRELGAW